MAIVYFYLSAVLYFIISIWCLVKFKITAAFLGYSFINNSGKVEYFSIYVGLQFGLAVFFALCGYFSAMRFTGIVFSVVLYLGIVLTRIGSCIIIGKVENATYIVGVLELGLLLWATLLLMKILLKQIDEELN